MRNKLPKLNSARITGITSQELLGSTLQEFSQVIHVPTEKDIGIDMRCENLNDGSPTGVHYNVQCKGTEMVQVDKDYFSVPIEVKTINYWLQQREPTFLIVVDRAKSIFYWTYPFEQIKNRIDALQKQDTVRIRVQKSESFMLGIKSLPISMLNIIYEYHYNILDKITESLELEMKQQDEVLSRKSPIQQYISISSSIEQVLKNIQVLDRLNKNLVDRISKIVDYEIEKYRDAIVALDHIPETRRYIKSGDIINDTGFGRDGITPKIIMDNVADSWTKYKENGYSNADLISLNSCLDKLYDLNQHLAYFLREMLYDNNPYGDHDYVIERYKQ
ncbi:hypothetical protein IIM_05137 [Bacillus cereus VD107]|nr:hypothetical protein IIM_05137 [Bacillus cereus VD107]